MGCCLSYAKDPALAKIEDVDSLRNACLMKIHEVCDSFVYEDELSPEQNEGRFVCLVRTSIRNALSDLCYLANLNKRKPTNHGLVSFTSAVDGDDEEITFEPIDTWGEHSVIEALHVKDVVARCMRELEGDECDIMRLIVSGVPAKNVAGKLGIQTSRVRYVLYEKIRPMVAELIDG